MMPVVSIIICTCNRAEHLRQTLAAMASIYVPQSMPTELIVVDNASTDDTAEVARQCQMPNMPVRYVHEPRRGQCYARNTGIAAAQGQVFLFTDDDVRPPKKWIEGMCEPILRGEADAIAGGVKIASHLERPWMSKLSEIWLASTKHTDPKSVGVLIGANMAFSRKILSKVSEFDTDIGPGQLGFGDDVLFSWQVQTAGFSIAGALETIVDHHFDEARLTRMSFLKRAQATGASLAYLSHHWLHSAVRLPRLRFFMHGIRLKVLQVLKWKDCVSKEGMAEWEMEAIQKVSFYRQYLREVKRPQKYQKHGLVKLPSL
jgi:glycosyltransferase involved in cell wall biosynthesis